MTPNEQIVIPLVTAAIREPFLAEDYPPTDADLSTTVASQLSWVKLEGSHPKCDVRFASGTQEDCAASSISPIRTDRRSKQGRPSRLEAHVIRHRMVCLRA